MKIKEIGFFKIREVNTAYVVGVFLVLGYFWLVFFSGAAKPDSSGDGKSLFLVPAFVGYGLYKIKQNLKRKITECADCKYSVDSEDGKYI